MQIRVHVSTDADRRKAEFQTVGIACAASVAGGCPPASQFPEGTAHSAAVKLSLSTAAQADEVQEHPAKSESR